MLVMEVGFLHAKHTCTNGYTHPHSLLDASSTKLEDFTYSVKYP